MADFLASTDVAAPADEFFGYLSQVENLPNYFEPMTSVTDNEDGIISVTADLGDRVVEAGEGLEQTVAVSKLIMESR